MLVVGGTLTNSSRKTGDKRGSKSVTKHMLTERDLRLDAESTTFGQRSIWQHVYGVMRCPGPPCPHGRHCWIDPAGKKHYRLLSHHLKDLIRHVERGGTLQTHDDVPLSIREQLYAEEQQKLNRKSGKLVRSPGNPSSVTINILPRQLHQNSPPDAQCRSGTQRQLKVWKSRVLVMSSYRNILTGSRSRSAILHSKKRFEKLGTRCWRRDTI